MTVSESKLVTPTEIVRLEGCRLRIGWSDGQVRDYSARELREACPCATCREQRGRAEPDPLQLTVLAPEETAPVDITGMRPTGAYAYAIKFSDGHGNGLFTFDLLRELGANVE